MICRVARRDLHSVVESVHPRGMRLVPVAAVALVLGSVRTAAAEEAAPLPPRTATLGIVGGFALFDLDQADPYARGEPRADGFIGASLAWDTPPPAYPARPGYVVHAEVVPEVQLLRIGDGGLVLGGLRFEVDLAQKEQGLFKVSARTSIWLAARAGVGVVADGIIGSVDVGSTIYVGDAWRFGYAIGALLWEQPEPLPLPIDGGPSYGPGSTELDAAMVVSVFLGSTI